MYGDFICPRLILIFKGNNDQKVIDFSPDEFYLAFSDFEHYLIDYTSCLDSISFYLVKYPGADYEECQKIISFRNLM